MARYPDYANRWEYHPIANRRRTIPWWRLKAIDSSVWVEPIKSVASIILSRSRSSVLANQPIRPTLFEPPPEVKSGQLWQFVAQRVGMTLGIISAEQLDNQAVAETVTKSLPSVDPKTVHEPRNLDKARSSEIKSIALSALNLDVCERDWELALTRVKEPTWEWEAQSLVPTALRARVQVNMRTKMARVYAYPQSK